MKLSEITRRAGPSVKTIEHDDTDWFEEVFASTDVHVEIEYEYEPEDYTDHPYGSTTARETHPANVTIGSVKLKKDAEFMDDDGMPTGKFEKAGTELMKQPYWTAGIEEDVEKYVWQQIGDGDDYVGPQWDD